MKTLFIALRSLAFMAAFLYLWTWVALGVRSWDAALGMVLPPWVRGLGVGLLGAGALLALTCVGCFVVRGQGTPAPFDAPREFVAVGPYRRVRNPMYLGGLMLLLGLGCYLRSGAIVVFAGAWVLLAHLFVIGYEEPALRRRFGAAYEAYCRNVRRWIPRR